MGWKVFAVVHAMIVLKSIFDPATDERYGAFEIFSLAMSVTAGVGLVLYAFDRRWWVAAPWRQFSWLFGLYSIWVLGLFVWRLHDKPIGNLDAAIGMVGAVVLLAALQYFSWLALWRYSSMSESAVAR